ncbi:UNKNOWN [Stylonychia lemnae]|uniref:Uncharacterized protein n=1 Tax=Stylonychia lemnae TaxID=5949 RepID=A0A078BBT5_STYLE|nr:UNKNOWN [Stylonychia lemnae]|eukprot:CDW90717.1 UNKNOWN [Stylonychia lemnae]
MKQAFFSLEANYGGLSKLLASILDVEPQDTNESIKTTFRGIHNSPHGVKLTQGGGQNLLLQSFTRAVDNVCGTASILLSKKLKLRKTLEDVDFRSRC